MSKPDQPELDELKKLLRRLEGAERPSLEGAERPSLEGAERPSPDGAEKSNLSRAKKEHLKAGEKVDQKNGSVKVGPDAATKDKQAATLKANDKAGGKNEKPVAHQNHTVNNKVASTVDKAGASTANSTANIGGQSNVKKTAKPSDIPKSEKPGKSPSKSSPEEIAARTATDKTAQNKAASKPKEPDPLLSLNISETGKSVIADSDRASSLGSFPGQLERTDQRTPHDRVALQSPGLPAVIDPDLQNASVQAPTSSVRIILISAITAAVVSSMAAAAITVFILRPDLLNSDISLAGIQRSDVSGAPDLPLPTQPSVGASSTTQQASDINAATETAPTTAQPSSPEKVTDQINAEDITKPIDQASGSNAGPAKALSSVETNEEIRSAKSQSNPSTQVETVDDQRSTQETVVGVRVEQVETIVNPVPVEVGTDDVAAPKAEVLQTAEVAWPASEPDKSPQPPKNTQPNTTQDQSLPVEPAFDETRTLNVAEATETEPQTNELNDQSTATVVELAEAVDQPSTRNEPATPDITVAALDLAPQPNDQQDQSDVTTDQDASVITEPQPFQPTLAGPSRFFVAPGVTVPLPIRISPNPEALRGHTLIFVGTTRNVEFSRGTKLMFDTWQVPVSELSEIMLTVPLGYAREIPLQIELRRPDGLVLDTQELSITTRGNASAFGLSQSDFDAASDKTEPTAQTLIHRAERLIDNGDALSARVLLERAADTGSALAYFILAATYDPALAEQLSVPLNRVDQNQAGLFYQRAADLGLSK